MGAHEMLTIVPFRVLWFPHPRLGCKQLTRHATLYFTLQPRGDAQFDAFVACRQQGRAGSHSR